MLLLLLLGTMTRDAFAETIFVSDFDVVCNQNAFYSDVGFCSRKLPFSGLFISVLKICILILL